MSIKDAPKRQVQLEEAVVPADSEAGQALLAEGGEAAKKYVFLALLHLKNQLLPLVVSLKHQAVHQAKPA